MIRLDAIGDYLLFRNFLKSIRESKKYKDYTITLCGNIAWKSLTEAYDSPYVDSCIWIERKRFYSDIPYKTGILRSIHKKGFESVIEATYSREILYGDAIVTATGASERIGNSGSLESHADWKRRLLTNKIYSELISLSDPDAFEFEANKEFISKALKETIDIKKPSIEASRVQPPKAHTRKYILLFPGTNEKTRMWSSANYRDVASFLLAQYTHDIVISGSRSEEYLWDEIVQTRDSRCKNYFGNSLPELAGLIGGAELLISNDTSAVHMAVSVNTPFICVSNGSYFGRFNPYPEGMFDKGHYVYPEAVMNLLKNKAELKNKYRFGSPLNINSVQPVTVNNIIRSILH